MTTFELQKINAAKVALHETIELYAKRRVNLASKYARKQLVDDIIEIFQKKYLKKV